MICCQAGWNRNSSLFRVWIDANSILGAAVAKPICVRINCVGYCYYKSFLNFVQQHKPAPSIRPEYLSSEKHLTSNFIFFEEPGWGPSFFVSCLYRMLTCRRGRRLGTWHTSRDPLGLHASLFLARLIRRRMCSFCIVLHSRHPILGPS